MRKITVLLCMVLLLLSSCGKNDINLEQSAENFDNTGEKIVLYCGEKTFPLSFAVDGEQQIQNGTYWYYELAEDFEKKPTDQYYTYSVKNCELNGLKGAEELKNCFATNGNWPLFLYPVHSEYSSANQASVDENLIAALNEKYADEVPFYVSDVWCVDLNGDEKNEFLFKGKDDEDGKVLLGFYAEGAVQELFFGSAEDISPLIADMNGDGKWELVTERTHNFSCFTVFSLGENQLTPCYEILF